MDDILSYGCTNMKTLDVHKNKGMEITYIQKGHLQWQVDGVAENISPGFVFFTLPWQAHGGVMEHEPGNTMYWILFKLDRFYEKPVSSFKFISKLGFSADEALELSRVFFSSEQHAWQASEDIGWLIPALITALDRGDKLSGQYALSLLRSTIIEFARIIKSGISGPPNKPVKIQRVAGFLQELKNNCGKEWTLKNMAEACDLKHAMFAKHVRELTGDSPMRYLNRVRVARAKVLLADKEKSVTDVALECGFSSSQYFNKVFKYFEDHTPTQYRNDIGARHTHKSQTDVPFRTEAEEAERLKTLRNLSWK